MEGELNRRIEARESLVSGKDKVYPAGISGVVVARWKFFQFPIRSFFSLSSPLFRDKTKQPISREGDEKMLENLSILPLIWRRLDAFPFIGYALKIRSRIEDGKTVGPAISAPAITFVIFRSALHPLSPSLSYI